MRNLFKPTSYRFGAALAVGSTAAWKAISFINALLIAAYFGACAETDLYFFLLITMGAGLYFLQRLNAAVIIPHAMTLDAQTPLAGRQLLNIFLYIYAGILGLFFLVGAYCPLAFLQLFSRFDTPLLLTQKPLIQWGLWLFGVQILVSYLTAILEMYKRFTAALFAPLNALLPLLFLLVLGKTAGVLSLMYGFVAANVIQLLVFAGVMQKELGWKWTLHRTWPGAVFFKNLLSNTTIEAVVLLSGCLPLYLLSGLSAGLVSALNYAKQLSDSATEVFTLRLANVAKIELTEHAALEDRAAFNTAYVRTHHFLCFLLAPLAVFSIFFAPEIITLFFKRGAFNTQDVAHASAFLRPLLGVMFLTAPVHMQHNLVAAQRKWKEFLPYALISVVLFIGALPFTMRYWGAFAYPYTLLATTVIGLGLNALFFQKYLPWAALRTSWTDSARLVSLNIIALLPTAVYAWFIGGKNPWIQVIGGGVIFLTALGALTRYSGDLSRALRLGR